MNRQILFEPEAAHELEAAALWYEAQRSGLGLAFLATVDRTVEHVTAWPDTGTPVAGVSASLAVRQTPVTRFPYRVVYMVAHEDLRVLAIAHDRRRPGYWRSRTEP